MSTQVLSRTRLRLHRALRIAISWVIVGSIAALFEHNVMVQHGLLGTLQERIQERILISLFAGLLGGGLYIFVLRDRWRRYSYAKAVSIMAILMAVVMTSVIAFVPRLSHPIPEGSHEVASDILTLSFLGHYLYWTLLMAGTMLMVRLNDQYGSGGINYLTGRYHRPKQEMRIFMFLDMRSSTAVAERIGHVEYFKLLNELYADITDSIVYSRGEIYQYVGDEVSVSWSLRNGVGRQRCIRCFLDIRRKLKRRATHYESRYGHAPLFKAGFHYGPVTVGEVGLVKKERIYTGDVVNTAAHIQGQCNAHGVDNLISQELMDVLRLPNAYQVRGIGSTDLKGKTNAIKLWTLLGTSDEE
ncbi:MAG: adenylate/guanylate cyclase domain-containing protein [Flavobacteriales bacterium]|nr:adenylate/guanylate cyclase domain-containing protein [Flavobacteriales bacterium]